MGTNDRSSSVITRLPARLSCGSPRALPPSVCSLHRVNVPRCSLMSRILSTRNLKDNPNAKASTAASIPSKISFTCREDQRERRPSTSETASSSDLSGDDASGSHEFGGAEKAEVADESYSEIGEEISETDTRPSPSHLNHARKDFDYDDNLEKSSWTDLDLSIIVSLISPLGSWLFGHDHVKNLFVILLLIFYLQQLITVPWRLYHSSRPRRPSPHIPAARKADDHHVRLARSELRLHELFYLMLTLASPFLGAFMLRKVVATVTGNDSMSWFSTNLFVLATCIRPWAHLVSRLRKRTRDLHDVIHYPSPEIQLIAEGHFEVVLKRMETLERELKNVKRVMAVRSNVNQAQEEMFGVVEDMEKTIKRQERKAEATRSSTDARLADLEATILRLESGRQLRERRPIGSTNAGALMRQLAFDVLELPHAIWTTVTVGHLRKTNPSLARTERDTIDVDRPSSSNHSHITQVKRNPRLETIPEYGDESNMVFVSANGGPRSGKRKPFRQPDIQSQTHNFSLVDFLLQVMLSPYHFSIRLLVALVPPVQKIFS